MKIQLIQNVEMIEFLKLNIEMYNSIDNSINEFGAINTVIYEMNTQQDFTAIGLYKDNELVGFVRGYCFSKKQFHFSGIYVKIKNNKYTKELIEFCFNLVKQKGYSAWSVNATNGNISSIIEKYGAQAKYTRYVKEIA